MAFGLGVLRWPPETFWRATPRELAAAAGLQAASAPDVEALRRLMDEALAAGPGPVLSG